MSHNSDHDASSSSALDAPHIATYHRALPVSLERLYENTIDWGIYLICIAPHLRGSTVWKQANGDFERKYGSGLEKTHNHLLSNSDWIGTATDG